MGYWDKRHTEARCEGCNAIILVKKHGDGSTTTQHRCEPYLKGVWLAQQKAVRA